MFNYVVSMDAALSVMLMCLGLVINNLSSLSLFCINSLALYEEEDTHMLFDF